MGSTSRKKTWIQKRQSTNEQTDNPTGSSLFGAPAAGPPRWFSPAETKSDLGRRRNTDRGLRGEEATEIRKWKRTCKRRLDRQANRNSKRATAQYPRDVVWETEAGARGREPKVIHRTNDIATLNIRSLAQKHKEKA